MSPDNSLHFRAPALSSARSRSTRPYALASRTVAALSVPVVRPTGAQALGHVGVLCLSLWVLVNAFGSEAKDLPGLVRLAWVLRRITDTGLSVSVTFAF